MAKQTFTTGQVLTAAQMTSLQQTAMLGGAASAKTASYTLVAADAGTAISMSNASATTITVNTALFAAGDTVHITNLGAGVCTITAGTATVNSSASLALAQYESGFLDFTSTSAAIFVKGAGAAASGGGLTLSQIATGTLSGTSVNFTGLSSYDTIVIAIVGGTWATANSDVRFRINGVSTGGKYYYMGGAGLATGSEQRVVAQGVDSFESNNNQTYNNNTNARILSFENCKSAGFTTLQENASYQNTSSNQENMNLQGWFADASAVSSIAITTTGGYSFNGGTYYVIAG